VLPKRYVNGRTAWVGQQIFTDGFAVRGLEEDGARRDERRGHGAPR
jgi:hypothetical protein